jgi:hypothetical protein
MWKKFCDKMQLEIGGEGKGIYISSTVYLLAYITK